MADRYGERQWGPERSRWDEERERFRDEYGRGGGRVRGEGYGGRSWGRGGYDPEYGRESWDPEYRGEFESGGEPRWRRSGEDRGLLDRAGDEVRSWFGDDDARRRRMIDDREAGYGERSTRSRGEQWGFGPWPGGRHLQEEWRQWGVEPSARRSYGRPGYGESGRGWTEWGDFGSWFGGESERERRGRYTGRGPRGYQRSDERIKEDICDRMAQHGALDATDIEVRVENAQVTLQGTVESRGAKRLAEDIVEDVYGVREVQNLLRVAIATAPQEQQQRSWPGERRVA